MSGENSIFKVDLRGVLLFLAFCIYFFSAMGLNLDHEYYQRYAEKSILILASRSSMGYLGLLFNEPLWLLLNHILYSILGNANLVIKTLYFSALLVKLKYIFRGKINWSIFFILFLVFTPFFYLHLRQMVALSVFLFALERPKFLKYFLVVSTPFIHIIFALIVPLYFLYEFRLNLKHIFYGFILAILPIFILLSTSGIDRILPRQLLIQSQYDPVGSGLGYILFCVLLMLFLLQRRPLTISRYFVLACLTIYLIIYPFTALPQRFLIIGFPFMLKELGSRADLSSYFGLVYLMLIMVV